MKNILAGAAFLLTVGIAGTAMAASAGYAPGHSTIYAGPGTNYPVVGHIAPHSSLDVEGCVAGFTWCNVFSHGKYGWTSGHNVMLVSHHHHIAIASAGDTDRPAIVVYNMHDYWDQHYSHEHFYAQREHYGYSSTPVPVAPTGRPPMDQPSDNANPSVHNDIPHMRDDQVYSK